MKRVQCNEYLVSIVDTGHMIFKHQSVSRYSAEYALMCFQLFIG